MFSKTLKKHCPLLKKICSQAQSGLEEKLTLEPGPAGSGPDPAQMNLAGSGRTRPDLAQTDLAGSGRTRPDLAQTDPAGSGSKRIRPDPADLAGSGSVIQTNDY